jgi:hypothetical protein
MSRAEPLRVIHPPARFREDGGEQGDVEDVVVEAAVDGVGAAAGSEGFGGARGGIAREIVEGEDLGEVGEVVFAGSAGEVLAEVSQRGDRPAVIEGAPGIGHEENEEAAWAGDAVPLAQGAERVGEMLETVAGEHPIIRTISDPGEGGRLAEELPAGGAAGGEDERCSVGEGGLPRRVAGEVDVVAGGEGVVEGNQSAGSESRARTADLQKTPVAAALGRVAG